jgi:hypothetical protein
MGTTTTTTEDSAGGTFGRNTEGEKRKAKERLVGQRSLFYNVVYKRDIYYYMRKINFLKK